MHVDLFVFALGAVSHSYSVRYLLYNVHMFVFLMPAGFRLLGF